MKLNILSESSENISLEKIAAIILKLAISGPLISDVNALSGGYGDNTSIFDAINRFGIYTLSKGLRVELEHTDNPSIALEIAIDHLTESSEYYEYLEDMERKLENIEEGYPGSSTGGFRSMPDKVMPDFMTDIDDDLLIDIDDYTYEEIIGVIN